MLWGDRLQPRAVAPGSRRAPHPDREPLVTRRALIVATAVSAVCPVGRAHPVVEDAAADAAYWRGRAERAEGACWPGSGDAGRSPRSAG
jgi:hypothetical protein